jgi:hypothetical protein
MTLRRERMPREIASALDGFRDICAFVDRARRSLSQATPTARFAGRPLPDVLMEFEVDLREATARMASWREPELQASCRCWTRSTTPSTPSDR